MSSPKPPPNLTKSVSRDRQCGKCEMYDMGRCWGYGNLPVYADWVCDSFEPDGKPTTLKEAGSGARSALRSRNG